MEFAHYKCPIIIIIIIISHIQASTYINKKKFYSHVLIGTSIWFFSFFFFQKDYNIIWNPL